MTKDLIVKRVFVANLVGFVLLAGCSLPPTAGQSPGAPGQPDGAPVANQNQTLTMAFRYEPVGLFAKLPGSGSSNDMKRFFNAALSLVDGAGTPRPYLAEALPLLNTDSWRVHPDGRMETTYRLRPGLTWHDGKPLTADDFVFTFRVYSASSLGIFVPKPQDQIEEVVAVDPRTVLIRWRSIYPDAGAIQNKDLDPLPRHLLEGALTAVETNPADQDVFVNHPYWSNEFVSVGPYRMDAWIPGTQIEGSAFEGHALGRPKIDRILIRFLTDENTVASNILAESVHYTGRHSLFFEHATVLKRDWAANNRGAVILSTDTRAYNDFQFKPDYQKTPTLLDVRVRRALAHSVDRQTLQDGLFDGEGELIYTFISNRMPYYPDVDRSMATYPYDPRRSEQLMNEAGFTKDRGGFFANAAGERFAPDYKGFTGTMFERGHAIMTDTWRKAGFDMQTSIIQTAQLRDTELRHTFPGMSIAQTSGAESSQDLFTTAQAGTRANRWRGQNRGGYSNPEFDRLWDAFSTTLDRKERDQQMVQMMRLISEDLPAIVIYANFVVETHLTTLRGPELGTPDSLMYWNVQEWSFQ